MTLCEFFGCTFLAFGPAIAMLTLTIAQDPIAVITVFASAFFWLLSALFSSIIWLLFGLTGMSQEVQIALSVILSVLCQEGFRFLLYKTLTLLDNGLKNMLETHTHLIDRKLMAYAAGIGFGVMSGIFSLINVLADAVGPATMGLRTGSDKFILVSACFTLCFVLLHIFWSIIIFPALDQRNMVQIAWVLVTHLLASTLTLLNSSGHSMLAIIPNYILVLLTACVAFHAAGGSMNSLKAVIASR
ncbi:gamma-secretase subunit Aph-1 [Thrips palmi]|uniref:Gamma-secretase subunit Aph-1 n=1 Tax=Thrips palmi TaxID=161013 RepID=A0A6P8ZR88_THRPL|nr:gamma-secretase subunit Aph-1 [Thrips palmi]